MLNKNLEIKERIEKLSKEVLYYDKMYAEGTPVITDSEYDKLYMELVDLENKYPEYKLDNSPTQRIIDTVVEGLEVVRHQFPILSQEKIKTEEDIRKFVNRVSINNVNHIILQHKLDGLTLVLHYKKGVLEKAVSRGNGIDGYDVTHLALNMDTIPKKLNKEINTIIRGEGIIFEEDFLKINEQLMKSNSGDLYKTARNLASGTMRSLNGSVARERNLQFIAFDVLESELNMDNDIEQLKFLKEENFKVVETKIYKINEINEMISYIKEFNTKVRPTLEYTIDGLVLKIDDIKSRRELGETSKYPKWACAYKFESLDATSKILDVSWQVGKTGIITPVAIIEPVEIDGVVISKASLANMDNIKLRDIRINDTVLVRRANDVIPQIVAPVKEVRTGLEKEIKMPKICPCCSTETYMDKAFVKCSNDLCEAKIENKIKHFVSRNAMNIEGLGDKAVELLIEEGLLNSICDIYELENNKDKIMSFEGYGAKKVNKILDNIEKSKEMPLDKVLFGLSINNIGQSKAKILANHFSNIENIFDFIKNNKDRKSELLNLEDFGDIISDSFLEYFDNEDNFKMIELLHNKYGLTMKKEENKVFIQETNSNIENNIDDKIFVITGTLSISRNDMKSKIESLGGKVTNSVSKKTNYLIMGDGEEGSSKHKKALELGTRILSENDFNNLLI